MGFVIGTAGHIDHGKTSLVRLLTGQDTDQLPSEKKRGISIDLGFAHFELPDRTRVGIVDVPGHERFIRNMVAGAHGLDLVLFVVAADDGVMPQSEEHFDILCSLGVMRAIFVVTKVDMVDDARFEEVKDEIEILVDGSPFQGASVLPVSNAAETGIGALKALIADTLCSVKTVDSINRFRMPIDRVFTIHGRGVVITGTPVSGNLSTDDEVAIVPGGETYRVRGLQSHGVDVDQARSGDRLAINLTGADLKTLHRGDVACDPVIARQTDRIDVSLSVTPHAVCDLKNGQRLRLHLGTAERSGTVTLLGESLVINRGDTGLAQIKLTDPLQAMTGDRFVIRDEQAEHTLGGGRVLDPVGTKSRKTDTLRLARLVALDEEKPIRAIEMLIDDASALGALAADLIFRMNITEHAFLDIVEASEGLMQLKAGSENWITSAANLDILNRNIESILSAFHKEQPATPGLSLEVLHHRIARGVDLRLFQAAVNLAVSTGHVNREGALLALPSHRAGLTKSQQVLAETYLTALEARPFSPPAPNLQDSNEKTIIAHLERQGKLVRVAQGLVFAASAYEVADQRLEDHLLRHGDISAAQFRDLLGTTRKYALALLEYFDRIGRTVRIGDIRKRGKLKIPTIR